MNSEERLHINKIAAKMLGNRASTELAEISEDSLIFPVVGDMLCEGNVGKFNIFENAEDTLSMIKLLLKKYSVFVDYSSSNKAYGVLRVRDTYVVTLPFVYDTYEDALGAAVLYIDTNMKFYDAK